MARFIARVLETQCLIVSFEADDIAQATRFVSDQRPAEVALQFPKQCYFTAPDLRYELQPFREEKPHVPK